MYNESFSSHESYVRSRQMFRLVLRYLESLQTVNRLNILLIQKGTAWTICNIKSGRKQRHKKCEPTESSTPN
jgi:hypothetical protein